MEHGGDLGTGCMACLFEYKGLYTWEKGRHIGTNNLVTVEQAKRVESLLELPHRVNGTLAYFMWQVVSLDKTNAVLPCGSAFEFDGTLDHFVDKVRRLFVVAVAIVQDDGCNACEQSLQEEGKDRMSLQWKFPSPTCPTILASRPLCRICSLVSSMI